MSPDSGIVLGLDAGGSVVKATAFDLATGVATTATEAVPVMHPQPGHSERDAEVLWQATCAVVRRALGESSRARRVLAIGVTAHGNGAYLVDHKLRPVSPAIQASDSRAAAYLSKDGRAERLLELRESLWNSCWPGQPGPILGWLAVHEPALLRRTASVLSCGDFLRARLTGEITGELTTWTCTGLFDCLIGQASPAALQALGIESLAGLFPDRCTTADSVGELTKEAADTLGLAANLPVVPGGVDNAATHLGAGVVDGNCIVVGAGTWSINQLAVSSSAMTMDGALGAVLPYAACRALPLNLALLIEASPTSASTFDWARRVTGSSSPRNDHTPYSDLLDALGRRPVRCDAPLFLPLVSGSRANPEARGAWLGVSASDGNSDLLRAAMEGVCFEHRRHIDRLARAAAPETPLRLTGGAARSRGWAQMFADTTARAVEISTVQEIGCVGAAVTAGRAIGVFEDLKQGTEALNPAHERLEPEPGKAAVFGERFARYAAWVARVEDEKW